MRTLGEISTDVEEALRKRDVETLEALIAEMQALGTPIAEAKALHVTGSVRVLTGDYPSALECYTNAFAVLEELGDRVGMLGIVANLGVLYTKIGDNALALQYLNKAIAMASEMGNQDGLATFHGNIAGVYRRTGEFALSLEHRGRALAILRELGDTSREASSNNSMGGLYALTGDYPRALEHCRRALALFEATGDRSGEAQSTTSIGNVYFATGDHALALEHHRRALGIYEELGDHASAAVALCNMGIVYEITGDGVAALEHHERSLAMQERLGDLHAIALTTGNIASVLIGLHRYDEAAEMLGKQSQMRMEDPNIRAVHCYNYADLFEHGGDIDAAHRYMTQALEIAVGTGLRAHAMKCHERLRNLAQKRNDFAGYIEHNNEYQRISDEIHGKEAMQRMATMEAERKVDGERREREKERALLFGALPRSVADRMIRGEDVSGDHFDHAAVMFLDIVGFTTHTSSMPPSDVVKLLENIFRTIDVICESHAVVKVKTIGDSYMCFRGDADATTNALSVAAMALDVMKHTFNWPDGTPLQFRVGMHIGPATAGVIGTQRLQYDVWGDTVNVASRMESAGEPGRVHVTEAFASELKRNTEYTIQNSIIESGNQESHEVPLVTRHLSLVTTPRGLIDVKGKGPMYTYWLESTE